MFSIWPSIEFLESSTIRSLSRARSNVQSISSSSRYTKDRLNHFEMSTAKKFVRSNNKSRNWLTTIPVDSSSCKSEQARPSLCIDLPGKIPPIGGQKKKEIEFNLQKFVSMSCRQRPSKRHASRPKCPTLMIDHYDSIIISRLIKIKKTFPHSDTVSRRRFSRQ